MVRVTQESDPTMADEVASQLSMTDTVGNLMTPQPSPGAKKLPTGESSPSQASPMAHVIAAAVHRETTVLETREDKRKFSVKKSENRMQYIRREGKIQLMGAPDENQQYDVYFQCAECSYKDPSAVSLPDRVFPVYVPPGRVVYPELLWLMKKWHVFEDWLNALIARPHTTIRRDSNGEMHASTAFVITGMIVLHVAPDDPVSADSQKVTQMGEALVEVFSSSRIPGASDSCKIHPPRVIRLKPVVVGVFPTIEMKGSGEVFALVMVSVNLTDSNPHQAFEKTATAGIIWGPATTSEQEDGFAKDAISVILRRTGKHMSITKDHRINPGRFLSTCPNTFGGTALFHPHMEFDGTALTKLQAELSEFCADRRDIVKVLPLASVPHLTEDSRIHSVLWHLSQTHHELMQRAFSGKNAVGENKRGWFW